MNRPIFYLLLLHLPAFAQLDFMVQIEKHWGAPKARALAGCFESEQWSSVERLQKQIQDYAERRPNAVSQPKKYFYTLRGILVQNHLECLMRTVAAETKGRFIAERGLKSSRSKWAPKSVPSEFGVDGLIYEVHEQRLRILYLGEAKSSFAIGSHETQLRAAIRHVRKWGMAVEEGYFEATAIDVARGADVYLPITAVDDREIFSRYLVLATKPAEPLESVHLRLPFEPEDLLQLARKMVSDWLKSIAGAAQASQRLSVQQSEVRDWITQHRRWPKSSHQEPNEAEVLKFVKDAGGQSAVYFEVLSDAERSLLMEAQQVPALGPVLKYLRQHPWVAIVAENILRAYPSSRNEVEAILQSSGLGAQPPCEPHFHKSPDAP